MSAREKKYLGLEEGDLEEDDIYTSEGREELSEDEEEITGLEEGFMQGYEEGEKMAKCALCGEILIRDFVEREIDGEIYRFCCEDHAEVFYKQKKAEI